MSKAVDYIATIFAEDVALQAYRVGAHPRGGESPGGWQDRVRATALRMHSDFITSDMSTTPTPTIPAGMVADDLLSHVRKMQEACANYIEPTTYIARHPDTDKIGDCAWVREFPVPDQNASDYGKAETNARRDAAFIRDIIYMLDGPEQRAAMLAAAPTPQAPVGQEVERCNMGVGCEEYGVCYAEANGQPSRCPKNAITVDQAISSIPSDAFWQVGHDGDGADPSQFKARVFDPMTMAKPAEGWGDTPADAILAALNAPTAVEKERGA